MTYFKKYKEKKDLDKVHLGLLKEESILNRKIEKDRISKINFAEKSLVNLLSWSDRLGSDEINLIHSIINKLKE
jgi:hypothetical protein